MEVYLVLTRAMNIVLKYYSPPRIVKFYMLCQHAGCTTKDLEGSLQHHMTLSKLSMLSLCDSDHPRHLFAGSLPRAATSIILLHPSPLPLCLICASIRHLHLSIQEIHTHSH